MKNDFFIKPVVFISLFLTIFTIGIGLLYPMGHPNRALGTYPQALLFAISLVFLIRTFTSNVMQKNGVHYSLLLFNMMILSYGIFTMDIYRIAVLTYAFLSFYVFYYLAYKDYLRQSHIRNMAVILLIFYTYVTYVGIGHRTEMYGEYFLRADNTGYNLLFLIPIFAMNFISKKNIFMALFSFLLIALSFKRGAMLLGAIVLILMLIQLLNIYRRANENKKEIAFAFILIIAISIYGISEYWSILSYRFTNDPTLSGRLNFYDWIYNGWLNGTWLNHLFGFGLYQVIEFLGNIYYIPIYAHSDWLELLYDHGILGIVLYSFICLTLITQKNNIKFYAPDLYWPYLMTMVIFFIKSIYSGIYINKDSIILMMTIAFIFGNANKNQSRMYLQDTNG